MINCQNVEMRDRLPDLANDTLVVAERELLLAHLADCAACTAEIEILRTARLILVTSTPKVNVAGIVMALPSYDSLPRAERGVSALPQYGVKPMSAAPSLKRRSWGNSWRIAAAVTFLAAGIGSYELMSDDSSRVRSPDSIPATATEPSVGLGLTAALTDMSDAELSALANDIENIEALPSTEIETTSGLNVPPILPDSAVLDLEVR